MAKKATPKYSLSGRITSSEGEPIPNLTVRAYDQDPQSSDNSLGDAVTNEEGHYSIRFTEARFKPDGKESGGPDVYIAVFFGDKMLGKSPVRRNAKKRVTIDLKVEEPEADAPTEPALRVSGAVRSKDGRPMPDVVLHAYDQGLGERRSELGKASADKTGRYVIAYSASQLLDPDRAVPNLQVEAKDASGKILAKSDIRFKARPQERIDLTLDSEAGLSEWERINQWLMPALEGLPLLQATDKDLSFLEKSTDLPTGQLKRRVLASQAAVQSGLPDWFHYALLRQGLPGEMDSLLDMPISRVREALSTAQKKVIVPAPSQEELEALWQRVETLQAKRVLDRPALGRKLRFGQILDAAGVDGNDQNALARALAGKNLKDPATWSGLQPETGLESDVIVRAAFAVRIAELTDEHEGVLNSLLKVGQVSSLRDLARDYGQDTWQALVDKAVREDAGDLPEDVSGEAPDERRRRFAERLFDRVAEAHPDVAVIYGLARRPILSDGPASRLLPRILEADPRFDIARARLDAYVREHREELGIREGNDAEEAAILDDLKRVQRVYRLRAEPRAVARLMEDGLDSSSAILSRGRERFLSDYGSEFGIDTARAIYSRAEANAARALAVYARFSPAINHRPLPTAIGDCPAELSGVPNYTTLFGALDGCECSGCESVYSPAAYLTDLLAFLQGEVRGAKESLAPNNGLAALETRSFCDRDGRLVSRWPRRPDILDVKLSCRNAETLVPYVDLVLEILENAVAPRDGGTPQTSLTAEELAAQPEHVIPAAYDKLAQAVFPFNLPFDLWHEEASIYLDKLGTKRAELLETFFPFAEGDSPHDLTETRRWQDITIAAARLDLTESEWRLIAGQPLSPPRSATEMWGFPPGAGQNWWHPLRSVDIFLQRSGLEYKDLLRLVTLKSFNPQGAISLKFKDLNDCDPKTILIANLSSQALSYLHRFLRLQRATGFSLQELDQVLSALAPETQQGRPAINELLLVRLSHMVSLRERLHPPLLELLSWWSQLGTTDYNAPNLPPSRSFYETLFMTGRPGDAQYDSFRLNAARTELKDPTQNLTEPVLLSAIAGAARLPVPDVLELTKSIFTGPDAAKLTLANVSLVFRHASLARTLRLSVEDYLTLKKLIGFDPFSAANGVDKTAQTLRFIERVELVKDSGFSIATLDYLLRQTEPYESGKTTAPTDGWMDGVLELVKGALKPLAPLGDPRHTILQAIEILGEGPGTTATADELQPLIKKALKEIGAVGEVGTNNALVSLLREALGLVASGSTVDHATLYPKLEQGREIIDGALIQAAATALSDALGIAAAAAVALLKHVNSPVAEETAGETLLKKFVPGSQGGGPSPTEAELRLLLRRLHKAALVVATLEISHQELPELVVKSSASGWLDLTALPVQGVIAEPAFEPWARLVRLIQFRNVLLPEQQENLFELFEIADQFQPGTAPHASQARQAYAAKLAVLSGWSSDGMLALVGKFDIGAISHGGGGMLKARFPQHFTDERLPRRILAAVTLLRRLGTTAFDAGSWVSPPSNSAQRNMQVDRIRNALKARYGDGWAEAVKKLRDPLRERQRQVLVTYLLHQWNLALADDLFDHFLIDVEMSPCMMTSRLIQATASVQLFVQRVLMNLEPGLYLTDEGAEQWDWMKNYRVWEANRKIFLYPENWIEPQLRDDKTPFFKDLENELMQADITNETAETALLHYLEKLHEVARLQVCGQYLEKGDPITLHVFARTRDVPHHYYYRRGVLDVNLDALTVGGSVAGAFDGAWTPWERVDVEVEGDHLIPIVYNRRPYLFWPIFNSEDEAPLTHTLQTIIQLFGQLFRLLTTIGDLIRSAAQGVGTVAVGGITNSIIEILNGMEDGINALIPGEDLDISLSSVRKEVREVRDELLDTIGEPTASLADLATIFEGVIASVQRYEDYLLSFLPAKRLEVQMAWSEHRGDGWSAKKVSASAVTFRDLVSTLFENLTGVPGLAKHGIRRLFTFQAQVNSDNELAVHCNVALPTSLLNPATYTSGDWLAEPLEIGFFRMNSCSGRLEAVDTPERVGFIELIGQAISEMLLAAGSIVENLRNDRQLNQRGEPVTPDDDPNRPSLLRHFIESGLFLPPLPRHFRPDSGEDVFRLLVRHQDTGYQSKIFGFFYQDAARSFFCFPWFLPENNRFKPPGKLGWVFFPFYHPYSCALLANLRRFGIQGLYDVRFSRPAQGSVQPHPDGQPLQIALVDEDYFAPTEYHPVNGVYNPPDGHRSLRPIEEIDFSAIGAYASYNWEIFFHIPYLVATRLSTDQKFREAQHWFHYIFNPTDASRGSVPEKYWRTRPFVETSAADYEQQQIHELLQMLNAEAETPGLQELEWAVRKWRNDAFNPHLVARARTVAFQKTVVMKYIDNLIAWGDSLFRRETREAVYEATQLYILAAKLLGPRPRRIPKGYKRPEYSYDELVKERPLDAFSNALVEVESYLPPPSGGLFIGKQPYVAPGHGRLDRASLAPASRAWRMLVNSRSFRDVIGGKGGWHDGGKQRDDALYFCVPPNDILLEKWDIVADRLFKIRHCQNIEGRALALPLLAPPIDPAILVRAKAAGVDIDSVLSQLYVPLPPYRFHVMAQKATEVCNEAKALGAALLSALEKRDGEELALLRSNHEMRLLKAVQGIKDKQVEEANHALAGLRKSRESTELRLSHYQGLLMAFVSPEEMASTALGAASLLLQVAQFGVSWGASAASIIPNIKGGFVTTLGVTFGGDNVSRAAENAATAIGQLSSILAGTGGLISTMGGFRRRAEDWLLQIQTAGKELESLDRQIAAAEIRVAIAESDLENHKLQVENSRETQDFMQQKFTNQELYDWMVGQTSTLYFQSYQLAYDLARKAERAFAFELGEEQPGIIRYGYWDNLKKGLLAGDHLHHDLKRLETAYLDRHRREYELTKHISLRYLAPLELIRLIETGAAEIALPEALFDMDFPGHYMRRVKSVSLSIPCITGPYTGVGATLRLQKSRIRWNPNADGGYGPNGDDDPRFATHHAATRAIATSTGQNDGGVFELNLRDERYLPFEGEGVESLWGLMINREFAQFDLNTISDVVMHIRYTARDGSDQLRTAALKSLEDLQTALTTLDGKPLPLTRLFSVRHEFPTEWAKFRSQTPPDGQLYELALSLKEEHYPFWSRGRLSGVERVDLLARSAQDPLPSRMEVADTADPNDAAATKDKLVNDPSLGNLLIGSLSNIGLPAKPIGLLKLFFDANVLDDLWIAVTWK